MGVGVPKGGIGHTGHIVSAPFAREKPPSPSGGHRSRKSGECRDGQWVGVGGQYPTLWPVGQSGSGEASRPKASIGRCGGGGVGGQSGEGAGGSP